MKVLTLTGYKAHELQIFKQDHPAVDVIKLAIKRRLNNLLEEHEQLEWVLISGQLGVELWAAEVVFELQEEWPRLKLAVITPFLEQEESWNENNKEYYEFILSQADYVDSVTKKKYDNPNQFRLKNQFLIQKSDGLLVVYDEERTGNPKYIVDLAKQKKSATNQSYEIIYIDFYELQLVMEEINEQKQNDF